MFSNCILIHLPAILQTTLAITRAATLVTLQYYAVDFMFYLWKISFPFITSDTNLQFAFIEIYPPLHPC